MIDLRLKKSLFNAKYLPYLTDYTHPTEIFWGGSGSGKSVFLAQKVLFKAIKSNRKVLIIRKNLVSQKESCWRLIEQILSQWKIKSYCNIRISDYSIELPNGSVLLFKGLDDPEKIKSIVGITDIWIEEATELNKEDYSQLKLRLRANADNLQMYLSYNPVSKANWCYSEFHQKEDPDILLVKSTFKDNKFLPQAYIDELQKMVETNPTYYKIYALGEFCSLDKLVFNYFEITDEEPPQDGLLLCGLDFGFTNDPTAFVASTIKDNELFIFKEWYAMGKTNNEIAEAIKELGFGKSAIIADSAEPKSIKELRECGLTRIRPSVKGPDSVIHGIQKMKQYKIKVHKSCVHTIEELQNYSWKKNKQTGEYENEPIDQWNHTLDAARYSLQLVHNQVRITDTRQKIGL